MSLMYELIKQGQNQDREEIARSLLGSGVKKQEVKEITGLPDQKVEHMSVDKDQGLK